MSRIERVSTGPIASFLEDRSICELALEKIDPQTGRVPTETIYDLFSLGGMAEEIVCEFLEAGLAGPAQLNVDIEQEAKEKRMQ